MIRARPAYLYALAIVLFGYAVFTALNSARLNQWINELQTPDATVSTVYLLDAAGWTEFDIAPPDGMVKLLFNAILADGPANPDMAPLEFAVEYELLDAAGASVLGPQQHYLRSSVPFFHHPTQPEPWPGNTLTRPYTALASAAQALQLDSWAGTMRADRVRVRQLALPGETRVRAVTVRGYTRPLLSEYKDTTGWLRMNRFNRARLAAGLAYPPELLDKDDQQALLRGQWVPIGPMGVDGADYFSARLRLNADDTMQPWASRFVPWGIYTDALRVATIPFKAPSGRVRIQVTPLQEGSPSQAQVTWYPAQPGPLDFELLNIDQPAERDWAEGWLAVQLAEPAVVRVFDAQSGTELTPEPRQTLTSKLALGDTLEFAVPHVLGEPTPMRLDIRSTDAWPLPAGPRPQTLHYRWLDAKGRLLDQGELNFPLTPSRSDWAGAYPQDSWVSDAHSVYWLVPGDASVLQLEAPQELLITAYDRPLRLRHVVNVPSAYQPWVNDELAQPVWFRLRPRRELDANTVLIRRQPAPPERDPDILAGQWQWRAWPAEGLVAGNWFLVPRGALSEERQEVLGSSYRPIAANINLQLQLETPADDGLVRAELLYRNRLGAVAPQIWIDDTPVAFGPVRGPHGRIPLPPLPAGRHRLRIEDGGQGVWLMNHIDGSAPTYLRVYAQRLDPGASLSIPVSAEPGPRDLSIRVLLRQPQQEAELLVRAQRAWLPGTRALPAWTIDERLYRVQMDATEETHDPLHLQWRAAPSLLLPLMEDWPSDAGRIEIRSLNADPVYVSVFELTPGVHAVSSARKDDPADVP